MRVTGRTTKMCEKALEKWGVDAQLVMVIEECSELIKEATKSLRGHQRRENIKDELADVVVMCEQLRIILGLTEEDLENIAEAKMLRAMQRAGITDFNISPVCCQPGRSYDNPLGTKMVP